jgi:hypothetical protein
MVKFESLAVILKLLDAWELLSLKFVNVQTPFTKDTSEQEPFIANRIELLKSGVIKMSAEVKTVLCSVCA